MAAEQADAQVAAEQADAQVAKAAMAAEQADAQVAKAAEAAEQTDAKAAKADAEAAKIAKAAKADAEAAKIANAAEQTDAKTAKADAEAAKIANAAEQTDAEAAKITKASKQADAKMVKKYADAAKIANTEKNNSDRDSRRKRNGEKKENIVKGKWICVGMDTADREICIFGPPLAINTAIETNDQLKNMTILDGLTWLTASSHEHRALTLDPIDDIHSAIAAAAKATSKMAKAAGQADTKTDSKTAKADIKTAEQAEKNENDWNLKRNRESLKEGWMRLDATADHETLIFGPNAIIAAGQNAATATPDQVKNMRSSDGWVWLKESPV